MVVKYLTKSRWKLLGRAEVHVHPGLDVLQLVELRVHPLLQNNFKEPDSTKPPK